MNINNQTVSAFGTVTLPSVSIPENFGLEVPKMPPIPSPSLQKPANGGANLLDLDFLEGIGSSSSSAKKPLIDLDLDLPRGNSSVPPSQPPPIAPAPVLAPTVTGLGNPFFGLQASTLAVASSGFAPYVAPPVAGNSLYGGTGIPGGPLAVNSTVLDPFAKKSATADPLALQKLAGLSLGGAVSAGVVNGGDTTPVFGALLDSGNFTADRESWLGSVSGKGLEISGTCK